MKTRSVVFLGLVFTVFVMLFVFSYIMKPYFIKQFFATMEQPLVTVTASTVKAGDWQPYLRAVGSFTAPQGAEISSQASGVVESIYFKSGEILERGAPMFQLDDVVDQAMLADNEAQRALAKISFKRQEGLLDKKAAASSAVDEARAKLKRAEAAVARTQALIAQKNIKAPFKGKVGIRKVNIGEYVHAGTTKLVSLQALDPLYIDFFIPEQHLRQVKSGQMVKLTVQAFPGRVFTGKISAIDAKVDVKTHNILVQATVPNDDLSLYPGMFAEINVLLEKQQQVVIVPKSAITYSLYGNEVFVIKQQGDAENPKYTVQRQFISTGEERGSEVVVLKGLTPGERVVDAGQLKLENGTRISIAEKVA